MSKRTKLSIFLKDKREQSGLSQKSVAQKLGYTTPQFISNWERGISMPPVKAAKKIASIYKISNDEMFKVMLEATLTDLRMDLKKKFYGKKSL